MKSLYSYFLMIMMIFFWISRIVAAITASLNISVGLETINLNIEIILLFVTLVSIVLIIKRNLIGAIIYLISYGGYFGVYLFQIFPSIMAGTVALNEYVKIFFAFLGIVLAILVLIDIILDKNRKAVPKNKKTDWFYQNEDYDRNLDDRADKNNYRTL